MKGGCKYISDYKGTSICGLKTAHDGLILCKGSLEDKEICP